MKVYNNTSNNLTVNDVLIPSFSVSDAVVSKIKTPLTLEFLDVSHTNKRLYTGYIPKTTSVVELTLKGIVINGMLFKYKQRHLQKKSDTKMIYIIFAAIVVAVIIAMLMRMK